MPRSETPSKTTNNRIVQKIRKEGFRSFIDWVGVDDGHVNPVFVAKFIHPALGKVEAFCKLYPLTNDNRGLVNEITGFLFGHSLNVPQPEHAFIANVPLEKLRDISRIFAPEHWIRNVGDTKDWIAFCTTRLDGKSAAIHLNDAEIQVVIEDVAGWIDLPRAVALDENIAHVDRHLNNLIRLGQKRYALIDNGRLVDGVSECWTKDMLAHDKLYRNRLSECIWKHRPDEDSISSLINFSLDHHEAFSRISEELAYWLKLLAPNDYAEFENFLKARASDLEWLLKRRYNRLI